MEKMKTIDSFFIKKDDSKSHKGSKNEPQPQEQENQQEKHIERDAAKRKQMFTFFARRLQLALVDPSKEIIPVYHFFTNLAFIINVICDSSKRHDEIEMSKSDEIKKLLELGEIKSGQVGILKRGGDTHWGSYFKYVCSLLKMYDVTLVVLEGIMDDEIYTTSSQHADADTAYVHIRSFEFMFILHMIEEVMGKADTLFQEMQKKFQDIVNAKELVSATKA